MEVFEHTATQMLIMFVMIFLGVIARRMNWMNDESSNMLSRLVMNISLPAMILSSVLTSEALPQPQMIGQIVVLSLLSYVPICVFAWLVSGLYCRGEYASQRGTHAFMIAFGNVGFMGLPVLGAIYGDTAVLYGAIYNIAFNLAAFTAGIAMIRQGTSEKPEKASPLERLKDAGHSVVNPCMAFSVLAVILALLNVTDTGGPVGTFVSYVGQMTLPASMLVIGCTLARQSLTSMVGHIRPYISALIKLLVVPLLVLFVTGFFVSDPVMLGVVVICAGMPVASLGGMLSLLYGGDVDTMMQGTFISTILSLVTIPLLAFLVAA